MGLNAVTAEFETALQKVIPPTCFRPMDDKYLSEPRGLHRGVAGLVLAPRATGEVAAIVTLCNQFRVGVIPFGGGTGLVAGQVQITGPAPVILSMERMNRIVEVDDQNNVAIVEAGAALASIHQAVADKDRLFPLSLASEGSCQIGGNLATNAGGVGVVRYGNARDLCLGLEAVLPDGSVWNGLKRLRKDNTGYDLKNLLIGAEGTLGVITAACLKLSPRPSQTVAAFLTIRDPGAALELLETCQLNLPGCVSAFELIHRQGFDFLAEKLPEIRLPFAALGDWMVLIDLGTTGPDPLVARLETVLATAIERGLVQDAVISQNQTQRQEFWAVRETIPEANRLIGAISSHDISVPISRIPELIEQGAGLVRGFGDLRINCFGHVGDGNLHYNVYPPKGKKRDYYSGLQDRLRAAIYDLVHSLDGSISAEHGIGRLKIKELQRYSDPAKLAMMQAIKLALDPNGIMNPGAVIPGN